jgi:hypothetical protein
MLMRACVARVEQDREAGVWLAKSDAEQPCSLRRRDLPNRISVTIPEEATAAFDRGGGVTVLHGDSKSHQGPN